MMPRMPSMSCTSVTRLRIFSSEFALEQRRSLDHDQDVVFARGEALRHFLELMELRRVGAEKLAQRIVDLDAHEAECGGDREQDQDDDARDREAERDQADPLDPIGEVMPLDARCRRAVATAIRSAGAAGRQTISPKHCPTRRQIETLLARASNRRIGASKPIVSGRTCAGDQSLFSPSSPSGCLAPGIAYAPESQRLRSTCAQRLEQNGCAPSSAGLPQIGHLRSLRRCARRLGSLTSGSPSGRRPGNPPRRGAPSSRRAPARRHWCRSRRAW